MTAGPETALDMGTTEDFPNHPLFEELKWFRGTPDPRKVVLTYIDRAEEEAEAELKNRGVTAPWHIGGKVKIEAIRAVRQYVSFIRRVSETACEKTSEQFPEEEVRIIQARTAFDFETWLARLLFVIDAAPEKILEFSELLTGLENSLLMEDGFVAQLDYLNKRGSDLDCTAIRRDFPFVGKVATRPQCIRSCESCGLE